MDFKKLLSLLVSLTCSLAISNLSLFRAIRVTWAPLWIAATATLSPIPLEPPRDSISVFMWACSKFSVFERNSIWGMKCLFSDYSLSNLANI